MSRGLLVLVAWTTPAPLLGEVLRLALAATGAGRVRLLAEKPPPSTLEGDSERSLEHLRVRGTELEVVDAAMLRSALEEADDVWCCVPRQDARQDVLAIDAAWLAQTPDEALWPALGRARHVLRIRHDALEQGRPDQADA